MEGEEEEAAAAREKMKINKINKMYERVWDF